MYYWVFSIFLLHLKAAETLTTNDSIADIIAEGHEIIANTHKLLENKLVPESNPRLRKEKMKKSGGKY